MQETKLTDVLARIESPRIAVIGDCMLDEYLWGPVDRVSPEAPIPVLRVERQEYRLGGASNVVANLAALGASVDFYGAIGKDSAGERVKELLDASGSPGGLLLEIPGYSTTRKARQIGYVQHADRASQQLLRVDSEVSLSLSESQIDQLLGALESRLDDLDAVLISDYDKGLLGEALLARVIDVAGKRHPVLVDPAIIDNYSRYRGAHLICPNRYETALATRLSCQNPGLCAAAGEWLAKEHGFGYVAVTMDRDGVYLCQASGANRHFQTEARMVTDVTGAGDMVLSVLGLVIGSGAPAEDAVRLANVAAGMVIRRVGSAPIPRSEVRTELFFRGHASSVKIKTHEDVVEKVQELRASGKKIVLTNGCFDLLHWGHHKLLNEARRHGDILVVAVNGDRSVRRLKGPRRPMIAERERMLSLSDLEAVDFVVLFEEDTPIALIQELRPDVLVKGSDYRDGVVIGREEVESQGGRVVLIDQVPGFSTTAIIDERVKDEDD